MSEPASFALKHEIYTPQAWGEPCDFVTHIRTTVLLTDADETSEEVVGVAYSKRFHGNRAYNEGGEQSVWEIFDNEDQDASNLFGAAFHWTEPDNWFDSRFNDLFNADVLYIGRIELHPLFRGIGLSTWVVQRIEDTFADNGGQTALFTFPKLWDRFRAMGFQQASEPGDDGGTTGGAFFVKPSEHGLTQKMPEVVVDEVTPSFSEAERN